MSSRILGGIVWYCIRCVVESRLTIQCISPQPMQANKSLRRTGNIIAWGLSRWPNIMPIVEQVRCNGCLALVGLIPSSVVRRSGRAG